MALQQIANEIQYNRDQVANITAHHTAVRDSLMALTSRIEHMGSPIPLQDIIYVIPGGFGVVRLQKHVWNLAVELGTLEHMEYQTATELSKVYDIQEKYLNLYDRLADNVFIASNLRSDTREGMVMGLMLLANDITQYEKDLLTIYDAVLEQIDGNRVAR